MFSFFPQSTVFLICVKKYSGPVGSIRSVKVHNLIKSLLIPASSRKIRSFFPSLKFCLKMRLLTLQGLHLRSATKTHTAHYKNIWDEKKNHMLEGKKLDFFIWSSTFRS